MKKFKILNSIISIDNEELWINTTKTKIKTITLKALVYFLESNGKLVTKDYLLDNLWKDSFVSEASAFKQVQLVKKILVNSDLPDDCIENIYGKGYKFKYEIEELEDESPIQKESLKVIKNNKSKYFISLLLLVTLLIMLTSIIKRNDNPIENFLSQIKRDNIKSLMVINRENGLNHVKKLLLNNKNQLTVSDLAYLYFIKGYSEHSLLDFQKSIEPYS